jgi:anti-anti-sigma factor
VNRDQASARVRLGGELDLGTVGVLKQQLAELRGEGSRHVIVDLSELQFVDSTGLRCLLDLNAEARQDGFSLALVPGSRAVQRVFEITRTIDLLPFIRG